MLQQPSLASSVSKALDDACLADAKQETIKDNQRSTAHRKQRSCFRKQPNLQRLEDGTSNRTD
jgi:hypothetical protein